MVRRCRYGGDRIAKRGGNEMETRRNGNEAGAKGILDEDETKRRRDAAEKTRYKAEMTRDEDVTRRSQDEEKKKWERSRDDEVGKKRGRSGDERCYVF